MNTLTPKLTDLNQLYTLGMKNAGLHSPTDEDWYNTNLVEGELYFVDLRNIGLLDWFIELYYIRPDGTGYYYTTDPAQDPIYLDKPEKYFYFEAEDTGTYYIRVSSGDDWEDSMHYFFYVGPSIQYFDIVDMPTRGGVKIYGTSGYNTYTCDLRGAVPAQTSIVSLSVTNSFPEGTVCSEVDKSLSAGGKTYYNTTGTGGIVINNISGTSLGQLWTIGGRCAKGTHFTYWSARFNGRFACVMEPYPGNEL